MIPCEVMNLKKMFKNIVGCEDVSFSVKPGEIFGLVGANGSGKSTTFNSIMGLIMPTSGEVALFQEDATKNGHKLRKDVGFLPGEVSFFPSLSVGDNLKFVADCKGVPYDKLNDLSTRLQLNLSRKAKDLSLGNKKKMGIVMAMLSSPNLIILDEPTDGLDPLVKQEFYKIVEEEKLRGASIVVSSHSLLDIQRLCDRVAIISRGKIVAIEQTQDLKLKRLKIVTIETRYSTPQITLSGVSNLTTEGNLIKFNYNGEMKKLINFLNNLDVDNIQITDSDLEKMFLHFYE